MSCELDVVDPDDIKELTEKYWEYGSGDNIECYMDALLGKELLYAQDHPFDAAGRTSARLRTLPKKVHTLALTVGESFEPLLQVICVLRPIRLVLVLNHNYGGTPGEVKGDALNRYVKRLSRLNPVAGLADDFQPNTVKPDDIQCEVLSAGSPAAVFRALQAAFGDKKSVAPEGFTNAVDVTGAKKSMVVGAFLFAAHSGLPITYVDFDDYSPDKRRPYGYTCRIGTIDDPYTAFRLRDWEQVRRLYNSFNFRSARELLGTSATKDQDGSGILGAMTRQWQADVDSLPGRKPAKASPLFNEAAVEATEKLAALLLIYELWENGDYTGAKLAAKATELPDTLIPWAVRTLGGLWPEVAAADSAVATASDLLQRHLSVKQGNEFNEDSLFAKPKQLLAYMRDENDKIKHLIQQNEDYRSALLRAAGLIEFSLKARICVCFLQRRVDFYEGKRPSVVLLTLPLTADENRLAFVQVTKETGGDLRRTAKDNDRLSLKFRNPLLSLKLKYEADLCIEDQPELIDKIVTLRNESIHTHLFIPSELAIEAEQAARNAVAEFGCWLRQFAPSEVDEAAAAAVSCPEWHNLCAEAMLNLDFLPPALRSKS